MVFWLPPSTSTVVHNRFRQHCYGREVSSWGGRYRYHQRGFLEEIPAIFVYTGVVVVRTEDASRLTRFLRQNGAETFVRQVLLRRQDERRLHGGATPRG